jgi:hypothetical protein
MTVAELIERLQEMNPEAEVHVMLQQHWPMESTLLGVCEGEDLLEEHDDADADHDVVFLVEGEHVGRGLKSAWRAAS